MYTNFLGLTFFLFNSMISMSFFYVSDSELLNFLTNFSSDEYNEPGSPKKNVPFKGNGQFSLRVFSGTPDKISNKEKLTSKCLLSVVIPP